jgi:hypothetical protein
MDKATERQHTQFTFSLSFADVMSGIAMGTHGHFRQFGYYIAMKGI